MPRPPESEATTGSESTRQDDTTAPSSTTSHNPSSVSDPYRQLSQSQWVPPYHQQSFPEQSQLQRVHQQWFPEQSQLQQAPPYHQQWFPEQSQLQPWEYVPESLSFTPLPLYNASGQYAQQRLHELPEGSSTIGYTFGSPSNLSPTIKPNPPSSVALTNTRKRRPQSKLPILSVSQETQKAEIAKLYRGYQKEVRPREGHYEDHLWKCTLGCDWSRGAKTDWERHEAVHYPQKIWICFHEDCFNRNTRSRVSFRKDLVRRHYLERHAIRLSDSDVEALSAEITHSLFPRECVFEGCTEIFKTWDSRVIHITRHLKRGDTLHRQQIKKHFTEEDMASHVDSRLEPNTSSQPEEQMDYSAQEKDENDDAEGDTGEDDTGDDDTEDDATEEDDIMDDDQGFAGAQGSGISRGLYKEQNANSGRIAVPEIFSELDRTIGCKDFMETVMRDMLCNSFDENFSKTSMNWLEETLKLYALQLGKTAARVEQYNTMLFVMQFRSELALMLQREWLQSDNSQRIRSLAITDQGEISGEDAGQVTQTTLLLERLRHDIYPIGYMDWHFAANSPAHEWLKARFMHFSQFAIPTDDIMTEIERTISECLLSASFIDDQTPNLPYTALFSMDLDLENFLTSHCPSGSRRYATDLSSYLALISDGHNVQALTLSQYLATVWPRNGKTFLDAIIKIVKNKSLSSFINGCVLDGWISQGKMMFNITGSVLDITEFVQQLAWLGSVCQVSAAENQLYTCRPLLCNLKVDTSVHRIGERKAYKGEIMFPLIKSSEKAPNADCWLELFRYPVVAQGFPTRKRGKDAYGLEIGLSVMLSLMHTQHINWYQDKIFIHGFSSMSSLTKHQDGSSIWHFSKDSSGQYISPLDTAKSCDNAHSIYEVLPNRHFLGWCLEFKYNAGTFDCGYDIEPSELGPSLGNGILSRTTVRQPKRVAQEHVWIVGDREDGYVNSGQTYLEKIKWIHKRIVVLWDTVNRKGWLINGTSALLHLVLASLELDRQSSTSIGCFRQEDLRRYPEEPENAAKNLLLDEQNLALRIQVYGGETIRLKRRVEDIYSCLHLLLEVQISKVAKGRISNDTLDGWDFLDVADNTHDPFVARTFPLHEDCSGWISLLEDTCAVTLFGDNFGEIISPRSSSLCKEWSELPSNKGLLAASIKDLDLISRTYGGSMKVVPRRLTKSTTWAILPDKFDKCDCSNISTYSSHNSLIQILVPSLMFRQDADGVGALCKGPSTGVAVFGPVDVTKWTRAGATSSEKGQSNKRRRLDDDYKHQDDNVATKLLDPVNTQTQTPTTTKFERPKPDEYSIAIICALHEELRAVRLLFDQPYAEPVFDKGDPQSYCFGRIDSRKVVAACLPGEYGTCSATLVATELKRSFQSIKACLLVGIGAGIPSKKHDVRLGDVVVSYPGDDHSGMIKYDFKKLMQSGETKRLGDYIKPPRGLVSAVTILAAETPKDDEPLKEFLEKIAKVDSNYGYPGEKQDKLYHPDSMHVYGQSTCSSCTGLVEREPRSSRHPRIHLGLIASGDQVVKHAHQRDKLYKEYGALCLEMEAAGVANILPCLVIRGICDYADSHKHDEWHNYASAVAAAYAKLLLQKARI